VRTICQGSKYHLDEDKNGDPRRPQSFPGVKHRNLVTAAFPARQRNGSGGTPSNGSAFAFTNVELYRHAAEKMINVIVFSRKPSYDAAL